MPQHRPRLAFVALLLAAGISQAMAGDAPKADAPAYGAKVDYCVAGLESILPGDYYACRAKYHLDRNHPGSAVSMLKEAAYWANKQAQYTLGLMYFNGDVEGVEANRPLGLAWLGLAAERKFPDFTRTYTEAVLHSTPEEQRQAGKLFLKLREKYGDAVAGPRAQHQFERMIQPMEEAAQGGGISYINGFSPLPQSASVVVAQLHEEADKAFAGLHGTVSIGTMQSDAAPAPASPPTGK